MRTQSNNSNPTVVRARDSNIFFTDSMQPTTTNQSNWANIRPFTGNVSYVINSPGCVLVAKMDVAGQPMHSHL